MNTYIDFKALHEKTDPLIIGNVWDVSSALTFEKLGFKCIGTSSAAIAKTLGYADAEELDFKDLLFIVERIKSNCNLPLSVDLEFGYGSNMFKIADNIELLFNLGIVGINLEDSYVIDNKRLHRDPHDFTIFLHALTKELSYRKIEMFINLRIDSYLLKVTNPLKETMERIQWYQESGVDGLFVPYCSSSQDIKLLATFSKLPLNIMWYPNLPSFKELRDLGVRRISMGSFLFDANNNQLESFIKEILAEQSFKNIFI